MAVEWTTESLKAIETDGVPESQGLEFKEVAPKKLDKAAPDRAKAEAQGLQEREEFLKDITGMANGGGGTVLYGVTNKGRILPLEDSAPETFDQLERRLRSWLKEGVEPTLDGIEFLRIPVDNGYVLQVRVPNTMAGPFWAKTPAPTDHRIFKIRRGTDVINMSYHEVRGTFDRHSNALLRAQAWSTERLDARRIPIPSGHVIPVVHIIPLTSFMQVADPVPAQAMQGADHLFAQLFHRGVSSLNNFDGLYLYDGARWAFPNAQVFRNGAIEICGDLGVENEDYPDNSPVAWFFDDIRLTQHILWSLLLGMKYRERLGSPTQTMVCITLQDANSAQMRVDYRYKNTDRVRLAVPPFVLDTPSQSEIERVTREACDMLVQAYGWAKAPAFREDGKWLGGYPQGFRT